MKESTIVYEVGRLYNPGVTEWLEGGEFGYGSDGHELLVVYRKPSATEIREFQQGRVRLGLLEYKGVIFIVYQVGRLPIADAPCHWNIPENERRLADPEPHEDHPLLHILLIAGDTGIISAMRIISLSPDFTRRLNALIHEQAKAPMCRGEFEAIVEGAYELYPSGCAMMAAAEITYRGGG